MLLIAILLEYFYPSTSRTLLSLSAAENDLYNAVKRSLAHTHNESFRKLLKVILYLLGLQCVTQKYLKLVYVGIKGSKAKSKSHHRGSVV